MITWHVWQLRWFNPYTNPPEGMPRLRVEMAFPETHKYARKCPPELESQMVLGGGWSVCHSVLPEPIKPLNETTLASIRKKRTMRRLQKHYPLFSGQFMAAEIERKPEYYTGITDARLEEKRNNILAEEQERRERLIGEYYRREE